MRELPLLACGTTSQIDEQAPVGFRTCLPGGSIAKFSIDPTTLQKLRSGPSLKFRATTDAETPLTFSISLKGLTAALKRLAALTASRRQEAVRPVSGKQHPTGSPG